MEEDKRRQARNEEILRSLERMEERTEVLTAKTDRIKLLHKQYLNYLKRIQMNQLTDKNKIHREDGKTPFVEKSASQILETGDLSVIKQTTTITSSKDDVIEKYFKSLSPKSRSILYDKATKSSNERMPFTVTYGDPKAHTLLKNTLGGGDTNAYASSAAITAADEIINSIYTKTFPNLNRTSLERVGFYDNIFEHKENGNDKVTTDFSTTATSADEKIDENGRVDIKLHYRKINSIDQNDVVNHIKNKEKAKSLNQNDDTTSQVDEIHTVVKRSAFKEDEKHRKGQLHQRDLSLLSQELNENRQPIGMYNESGELTKYNEDAQIPQISDGHGQPFVNYNQNSRDEENSQSAHHSQVDGLQTEHHNHQQYNDSYQTVDQNYHSSTEATDFPLSNNTLQDISNNIQVNQEHQQNGGICESIGEKEWSQANQHRYEENVETNQHVASANADEKQDLYEATISNQDQVNEYQYNKINANSEESNVQKTKPEQPDQLEYDQSNPKTTENMQPNEYQTGEQTYGISGQDQEQYDQQQYDQQQYDLQSYDQQQYDPQQCDQQQYDQQQYDQQLYGRTNEQTYGTSDQEQQQYDQQSYDQTSGQSYGIVDQDQQQYDQANEQIYGTSDHDQHQYDRQSYGQTGEQPYGAGDQDQQQYNQQPYDQVNEQTYGTSDQDQQQHNQTEEQTYASADQVQQQYSQQSYDQTGYAGDQYYQGEYDQNDPQYYNQQYDENGHPMQYYDQTGEAVQPNCDENGQSIEQEYNNQTEQPVQQNYEGTEYAYDNHQENQYTENKIVDDVENIADNKNQAEEKSANLELQPETDGTDTRYDDEPTSPQAINVAKMLDTDTESIKQDTKISNDSDFDFSNS